VITLGERVDMNKRSTKDVVISVRVDSRALAVVARYYREEGEYISSKSQLVGMIVEDMRRLLVQNNLSENILSVEDARDYLEEIGLGSLNTSGRGNLNLFKALQAENMGLEGIGPRTTFDRSDSMQQKKSAQLQRELDAIEADPSAFREEMNRIRANVDAEQVKKAAEELAKVPKKGEES
jgi:hypothetical protein